jgi:hypothetical protein
MADFQITDKEAVGLSKEYSCFYCGIKFSHDEKRIVLVDNQEPIPLGVVVFHEECKKRADKQQNWSWIDKSEEKQ